MLEESGISPHHPVQIKLKRSFQGLVTRVQATPSALPSPIIGCPREPRCWDFDLSFRAKTGAIHPSMGSRISEKGKQLYTDLFNDVESTLTWPAQIQTLLYFLVPKTPTGERPIGLMPSIVRVWERMRKPILDQGMISQTRSYVWACKGRSAEMAAWQHLVLEEGQDDKPGVGRGYGAVGHDEVL